MGEATGKDRLSFIGDVCVTEQHPEQGIEVAVGGKGFDMRVAGFPKASREMRVILNAQVCESAWGLPVEFRLPDAILAIRTPCAQSRWA